eukprot:3836113-Ditylum_brightwellii.AAC.1
MDCCCWRRNAFGLNAWAGCALLYIFMFSIMLGCVYPAYCAASCNSISSSCASALLWTPVTKMRLNAL